MFPCACAHECACLYVEQRPGDADKPVNCLPQPRHQPVCQGADSQVTDNYENYENDSVRARTHTVTRDRQPQTHSLSFPPSLPPSLSLPLSLPPSLPLPPSFPPSLSPRCLSVSSDQIGAVVKDVYIYICIYIYMYICIYIYQIGAVAKDSAVGRFLRPQCPPSRRTTFCGNLHGSR